MRKLPNINEVVAKVKKRALEKMAEEREKTAGLNVPDVTTSAAKNMVKLAQLIRSTDPEKVTYADMHEFAQQLRR